MENKKQNVVVKKENNKKEFTKENNGDGVKVAFENSIKNLHERLDKTWSTEGGKKFLTHLMFAFLPVSKKDVFRIGKFEDHPKYKDLEKVCALTGFAVADSNFTMDEVTKKFFEGKGKKVNKLVFAITCYGSNESTKIISNQALQSLCDWASLKSTGKDIVVREEFIKLLISIKKKSEPKKEQVDETKEMKFHKQPQSTYTLADKFDFDAMKKKIIDNTKEKLKK